jgi:hypothetical protein
MTDCTVSAVTKGAIESKLNGSESSNGHDADEDSSATHGLRLIRSANGVDARISLWTCFYRFVIGVHHAEMIKNDFRTKQAFAKWAKAANLAFHLPRGYSLTGKTNKSPRKYYRALTQFWRWYQLLFGSSSAVTVVEEKFGFGLRCARLPKRREAVTAFCAMKACLVSCLSSRRRTTIRCETLAIRACLWAMASSTFWRVRCR